MHEVIAKLWQALLGGKCFHGNEIWTSKPSIKEDVSEIGEEILKTEIKKAEGQTKENKNA